MTRTPDISLVWFHQTSPDHQGSESPPWLCVCTAAKTSRHLSPTGGPRNQQAFSLPLSSLEWSGVGEAHSHGPSACSPQQSKLKDLSVTGTSVTGLLSLSIYFDHHFKRSFFEVALLRGEERTWGWKLLIVRVTEPIEVRLLRDSSRAQEHVWRTQGAPGQARRGGLWFHMLVNHSHNHGQRKWGWCPAFLKLVRDLTFHNSPCL